MQTTQEHRPEIPALSAEDLDVLPNLDGARAVVDYVVPLGFQMTERAVKTAALAGELRYVLLRNRRHFSRRDVREWLIRGRAPRLGSRSGQ